MFFLYGLRLICRLVLVRVTYRRAPRPLSGLFARMTKIKALNIINGNWEPPGGRQCLDEIL